MLRSLPWIILGGIALIVAVIVAPILGTYFYLRSPQRVVTNAFVRLLEAKSFAFDLQLEQATKDGFSLNSKGALDKSLLSKPLADLTFSFQSGQSFYGNGEARAKDGQLYLRFAQIAGVPEVLPGALQSVWAGIGMDALIAVGKEQVFPQAAGNLTEDDLQAIRAMIEKHVPVTAVGYGKAATIDYLPTMHYAVQLDRVAAREMAAEIKAAVKGAPLSAEEQAALARQIAALPPINGEIWVAKSDGRLAAAVVVIGKGDPTTHLNVGFSRYDQPVIAEAPMDSRPLIELVRRLIGNTLSKVTLRLPFEIPAPILDIEMKIPTVDLPAGGRSGAPENLGGLPDLIKLFYGTDKPFADPLKRR
jgi:hypothetical protein